MQSAAEAVKRRRAGRSSPAAPAVHSRQQQTPGMPSKMKKAARSGGKAGRGDASGSASNLHGAVRAVKQEAEGPANRMDTGASHKRDTVGGSHDAGAATDSGIAAAGAGKGKAAAKRKRGTTAKAAAAAKARRAGAAALASVPEGKSSVDGPARSVQRAQRAAEAVRAEPQSNERDVSAADADGEAPPAAASTEVKPSQAAPPGKTAQASQRAVGRRKGTPPAADGVEAQPGSDAATDATANGGGSDPK